jgi:hypothetical protein
VLSTRLFVFAEDLTSAFFLGLVDCVVIGLVIPISNYLVKFFPSDEILHLYPCLLWIPCGLDPHVMPGCLDIGYHFSFLDYLHMNAPHIGYALLLLCYLLVDFYFPWPARGTHIWMHRIFLSYLGRMKNLSPATLPRI